MSEQVLDYQTYGMSEDLLALHLLSRPHFSSLPMKFSSLVSPHTLLKKKKSGIILGKIKNFHNIQTVSHIPSDLGSQVKLTSTTTGRQAMLSSRGIMMYFLKNNILKFVSYTV